MPAFRGWIEVRRLRQGLENVIQRAQGGHVLEVEADYARLLIVEISGYVETSLQELLQETCRRQAFGYALSYAIAQLEWSHNPTSEAIGSILQQFSPALMDGWDAMLLEHPERKAALNSVVGLRNSVAHGSRPSISLGRTLEYLASIDELVDWLIAVLDPAPDSR